MSHKNKLDPVAFLKLAHDAGGVVTFDCETTGKNAFTCTPLLYTLSAGKGAGIHSIALRPTKMVHEYLRGIFTDPTLKVVMHNSSFDCKIVHRFICRFRKVKATILDTMVLAWLVDNRGARKYGKPFSLKSLAQHYLGHKMKTLDEIFVSGPLALRRKALEKRALSLKKNWERLAKRHEARFKRFLRMEHGIARAAVKADATMPPAEKRSFNAQLTEQYKSYRYDFPRARQAMLRRLAYYKREHDKITPALQAMFVQYALDDASVTLRLFWLFRKKLVQLGLDKWARVEMACRNLATDMELNGVELDHAMLTKLDQQFVPEIERVQEECYKLAGEKAGQDRLVFNLQSLHEVSAVLHNLIGAFPDPQYVTIEESAESAKKRAADPTLAPWFKTSKRVLQYTKHPLAQKILEYRALVKLRGTYTKKLSNVKGRLHAFFRSSGTDTGRFSSSGPNLQNIPSRSPVGKKIREAFVARPGFVLIVADLSQIELRVGATVCDEPVMLETFNRYVTRPDGTRDYTVGDIHDVTQKGLQEICPFDVTREHAKVANFALLYGQSSVSFALLYLLAFDVAEAIRTAFFEKYRAVMAMLEHLGALWRYDKIRSWRIPFSGRHRHWDRFDYVYDANTGEQFRTDTKVSKGNILNTLVQGSAADVFKIALRAFWQWVVLHPDFEDAVFPTMQVHDEVVVEVREDVAVFVAQLLKYCMEYPWFDTPCPILADVHIVNRWSEGKNGKREKRDENGKPIMGENGKPVMEEVLPEMNAGLKYLTPDVLEKCRKYIPKLPSIDIHKSYVLTAEEVAVTRN